MAPPPARVFPVSEVWTRYTELLPDQRPQMVALMVFAMGAVLVARGPLRQNWATALSPRRRGIARWVVVFLATLVAVKVAVDKASIFDDAFISFRYAQNLVEGHGLVFNEGERVEGYTNFLWTVFIALGVKLTPWDAPTLGVYGCLACLVANLVVVDRIARALEPRAQARSLLPLAVLWLAVQDTFTEFGTTGMETMSGSLFVNLGLLSLIRTEAPKHAWRTGTWFILAALTRPDHGLFYAVAGLALTVEEAKGLYRSRRASETLPWRRTVVRLGSYAAAFIPYAVYLGWKLSYYGQILPNTYYAKSAEFSYWAQGKIYFAAWHLAAHMWALAIPAVAWIFLRARSDGERRGRFFIVGAIVLYEIYVAKVGGGFMFGRFYLVLAPLFAIAAARVLERALAWSHRTWIGLLVAAPLAASLTATAGGTPMMGPGQHHWYMVSERSYYPIDSWSPMTVRHGNSKFGKILGTLPAAGHRPLIATSGIGMLGYYSKLPIIDLVGLADAHVAHQKLEKRRRPGHEKWAEREYIESRQPMLVRDARYIPRRYRDITRISAPSHMGGNRWHVFRYDPALMAALREAAPEIRFTNMESYLDKYISGMPRKSRHRIVSDLAFFKRFYFEPSGDVKRLERIQAYLSESRRGRGR